MKLSMKSDILFWSSSVGVEADVRAVATVTGIGDCEGARDGTGVGVEVRAALGKGMFEAAVGPSIAVGEPVAVAVGCGVLAPVEAT